MSVSSASMAPARWAIRERMKSRPSGKARVSRTPSRAIGAALASRGLMTGLARSTTSAQWARSSATSPSPPGTAGAGAAGGGAAGRAASCVGAGRRGSAARAAGGDAAGSARAAGGGTVAADGLGGDGCAAASTLSSSSSSRARPSRAPTPAASASGAQDGGEAARSGRIGGGGEQPPARLLLGLGGDLRHVPAGIGQLGDACQRRGRIGGDVGIDERADGGVVGQADGLAHVVGGHPPGAKDRTWSSSDSASRMPPSARRAMRASASVIGLDALAGARCGPAWRR